MGASFEFIDNSVKVKKALRDKGIKWLYEACIELEARTKENSGVKTGKTKGSFQYKVDESSLEGTIGSGYENAVWEEFGTGEYALNHDGRKGGWWILLDAGGMTEAQAIEYGYTIHEAKDGKKYVFTKGKKPKRPMFRAFTSKKNKLIRRAQEIFGGKE